jgi:hypothetical protein
MDHGVKPGDDEKAESFRGCLKSEVRMYEAPAMRRVAIPLPLYASALTKTASVAELRHGCGKAPHRNLRKYSHWL